MGYPMILVTAIPKAGEFGKLRDELLSFWHSIFEARLISKRNRDVYSAGTKLFMAGILTGRVCQRGVTKALRPFKARKDSPLAGFSVRLLRSGYLHDSDPCGCRRPAFLVLKSDWKWLLSPIRCGS